MAAGRSSARTTVLRSALLFAPFLAVAAVALAFLVTDGASNGWGAGTVVAVALVGSVTLLLAYQVVQSLRDVFARPVETVGPVEKRWSRSDMFLFRNAYVFVGRDVFRLPPDADIQTGDVVRIRHSPHTAAVEEIEVVERAGAKEASRA